MSNRRDEKLGHLVQAASRVVARFGARKTTLEDIAEEAGVSRASLYYYFPNREAIFRAVVADELAKVQAAIAPAIDPAAPADERLMSFVRARHQHLRELKSFYSVAKNVPRELLPVVEEEIAHFTAAEHQLLVDMLREGRDSGLFEVADCVLLATALQTALRGLEEEFVFSEQDTLEDGAVCLVETLLRGLRKRG